MAMTETNVSVVRDFARYPGPRYRDDGPFSGQQFREEVLAPRLRQSILNRSELVVLIDGVAGYGSSFLEEAFAGLLRHGFSYDQIRSHLVIHADTSRFKHHQLRAQKYIEEERLRQR